MRTNGQKSKRLSGSLLVVSAVACLAAACADIHPAPNEEEGGVLESPTHEADALREDEQHQEEGGRR